MVSFIIISWFRDVSDVKILGFLALPPTLTSVSEEPQAFFFVSKFSFHF